MLNEVAKKLKIKEALYNLIKDEKQVNLAMSEIIFKCIHQGSKFASLRLFDKYAIKDVLNLDDISKYDI